MLLFKEIRLMKMTERQFELIKANLKKLTSKPCFYKEKFRGIDIDNIKTQEDFEKIFTLI